MTVESSLFIAGEPESEIENVTIQDMQLTMKSQGTQKPELFDEQPSVRNVYPHDIPGVYGRSVRDLHVSGIIRREGRYREYPLTELKDYTNAEIRIKER